MKIKNLALLLALPACGPDIAIVFGDGSGLESSAGSETGDGDGADEPDARPDMPGDGDGGDDGCKVADIECDTDLVCWAHADGWSAWARHGIAATLGELVDSFEFTDEDLGVDGDCYDVANSIDHVCVVEVNCVELLARPVSEVIAKSSECADPGPWTPVELDGIDGCFGLVGHAVIQLDTSR